MASTLTFVILSGQSDFPIYDADLTGRRENVRPHCRRRQNAKTPTPNHAPRRLLPRSPPPPPHLPTLRANTHITPTPTPKQTKQQAQQYLHQFVLHSALDALDDACWASASRGDCHLRQVDRFNALSVSGYVTPGGARMLLLHDGRPADEAVRSFFLEVHDAYVRAALNPLQAPGARLVPSRAFDARVRAAARRALGAPAVAAGGG